MTDGWWAEEKHRLITAVEKIANNFNQTPEPDSGELLATKKIFLGTILGTIELITGVLNDPSLDVIKKHTELRKLVQRLEKTALRVEQDINNEMGQLPHSFDV
jgi:hypothetical protein